MKVKVLRSPGSSWCCGLKEGETGTVDDALGRRLVAARIAEQIEDPKPPTSPEIKTVPPEPKIADATPPEIQAGDGKSDSDGISVPGASLVERSRYEVANASPAGDEWDIELPKAKHVKPKAKPVDSASSPE